MTAAAVRAIAERMVVKMVCELPAEAATIAALVLTELRPHEVGGRLGRREGLDKVLEADGRGNRPSWVGRRSNQGAPSTSPPFGVVPPGTTK